MTEGSHSPVTHDHEALLARAMRRKGFVAAYDELSAGYDLARRLLKARLDAGLTQAEVAGRMGTTKSAVSRLESGGRHSPSLSTLQRYAQAVACDVELRLVPQAKGSAGLTGSELRDANGRCAASG
jgi:DNA-binding XRE family transcriptional regulator